MLPRCALEAHLPGGRNLHGAVPRGACGRLLADHLVSLVHNLSMLTPQEARGAAQATINLLVTGLMAVPLMLEWVRPDIEDALLTRTCQSVHRNLADPELSVPMICESFSVSRATLYRLLEPIGGVVQYVKAQRLKRAHAELLSSAGRNRRLASLAESMGFKDPAHFSRIFKQHFGYSPSDAGSQLPGSRSGADSDTAAYFAKMRSLQR